MTIYLTQSFFRQVTSLKMFHASVRTAFPGGPVDEGTEPTLGLLPVSFSILGSIRYSICLVRLDLDYELASTRGHGAFQRDARASA